MRATSSLLALRLRFTSLLRRTPMQGLAASNHCRGRNAKLYILERSARVRLASTGPLFLVMESWKSDMMLYVIEDSLCLAKRDSTLVFQRRISSAPVFFFLP